MYILIVAEQIDPEEEGHTTEGIYTQLRVCCTKLSCNFVTEILIAHNVAILCLPKVVLRSKTLTEPAISILFIAQYVKPIYSGKMCAA